MQSKALTTGLAPHGVVSGKQLSNMELPLSFLDEVQFIDCSLQNVDFRRSDLNRSRWTSCVSKQGLSLDLCDLHDIAVQECSFNQSIFRNSSCTSGVFVDTTFTNCNFRLTEYNSCYFLNCRFEKCDFSRSFWGFNAFFYCTFLKNRTSNQLFDTSYFDDCRFEGHTFQEEAFETLYGLRMANLLSCKLGRTRLNPAKQVRPASSKHRSTKDLFWSYFYDDNFDDEVWRFFDSHQNRDPFAFHTRPDRVLELWSYWFYAAYRKRHLPALGMLGLHALGSSLAARKPRIIASKIVAALDPVRRGFVESLVEASELSQGARPGTYELHYLGPVQPKELIKSVQLMGECLGNAGASIRLLSVESGSKKLRVKANKKGARSLVVACAAAGCKLEESSRSRKKPSHSKRKKKPLELSIPGVLDFGLTPRRIELDIVGRLWLSIDTRWLVALGTAAIVGLKQLI